MLDPDAAGRAGRARPARDGRPRAARGAPCRPRRRGGDGERARARSTSSGRGRIEPAPMWSSPASDEVRETIERILAPTGRRVDELSPMADARLADGSRVNVVVPPLAVDGPAISIRRFGAERPGPAELVESGSVAPAAAEILSSRRCEAGARVLGHRRHRLGQDDAPERALGLDRAGRAGDHDRGRGRASPAPAPRRPAREPAGVGGGQGGGDDPRPAAQRAADAPGPDRDRRGARRRGARSPHGAQHRPRRRPLDPARELARGRAPPARDAGADGGGRPAPRGDPGPGCCAAST